MNRVEVIGRIANDLELKVTQTGKSVLEFSVVDNEKNGNKEIVTYINCVVWEKQAEIISKYSKKGDMIFVEGKYRNEKYVDKEGKNRYKTYLLVNGFTFLPNYREQKEETNDLGYTEEEIPFY